MSILKEFRTLEQALKLQQEKLEMLTHNEQLGKALEFEKRLIALLKRYSLNMQDLQDFVRTPDAPLSAGVGEERSVYKMAKARKAATAKTGKRPT